MAYMVMDINFKNKKDDTRQKWKQKKNQYF